MGQGTMACMRYILFAFTLVFVIFGVLLVYTGLSTFISLNKYDLVVHNRPDGATIVLLTVGLVIFLISFMGCCGALTGNDFMLRSFSFILTVLLIIELVSVVFVFTFKNTIHQSMETGIEEAIRKYNETDKDSAISLMIDDIQTHFNCCGATGPADWKKFNFHYNETGDHLPKSCCYKDVSNETSVCTIYSHRLYKDGCVNIITEELKSSVSYLGSLVITVIVLQILGIAFSCMLAGQRRQYAYV